MDGRRGSISFSRDANSPPLLEAKGITKSFDRNLVLSEIDLTVQPAEIHAVVGENGAGKSTLRKILGGVYRPDSGQILISGSPFQPKSPREAIENGIVVIHQELSLTSHLSTEENIFSGSLSGDSIWLR